MLTSIMTPMIYSTQTVVNVLQLRWDEATDGNDAKCYLGRTETIEVQHNDYPGPYNVFTIGFPHRSQIIGTVVVTIISTRSINVWDWESGLSVRVVLSEAVVSSFEESKSPSGSNHSFCHNHSPQFHDEKTWLFEHGILIHQSRSPRLCWSYIDLCSLRPDTPPVLHLEVVDILNPSSFGSIAPRGSLSWQGPSGVGSSAGLGLLGIQKSSAGPSMRPGGWMSNNHEVVEATVLMDQGGLDPPKLKTKTLMTIPSPLGLQRHLTPQLFATPARSCVVAHGISYLRKILPDFSTVRTCKVKLNNDLLRTTDSFGGKKDLLMTKLDMVFKRPMERRESNETTPTRGIDVQIGVGQTSICSVLDVFSGCTVIYSQGHGETLGHGVRNGEWVGENITVVQFL